MGKKILEEGKHSNKTKNNNENIVSKSQTKVTVQDSYADYDNDPLEPSVYEDYGFRIIREIGGGSYATVYHAVSTDDQIDQDFAIKVNYGNVSRKLIFAEIGFLFLVRKRTNLPKIQKVIMDNENPLIVLNLFEFKPFTTYFYYFSIQDIKHYLIQLLKGLKNLKDVGIFHRDIKPGNFLYNVDKKVGIIIDFGLSEIDKQYMINLRQQLEQESKGKFQLSKLAETCSIYEKIIEALDDVGHNKVGTQTYMPLQSLLKTQNQSYAIDIWPVGVIMLQLLLKKYILFENLPIQGEAEKTYNERNQYLINFIIQLAMFFGDDKVVEGCQSLGFFLKLPENIPKVSIRQHCRVDGYDNTAEDLLLKLMALNPDKRISAEDALMHPFFDTVRNEHMKDGCWKAFKKEKEEDMRLRSRKETDSQMGQK